ncbi:M48 family metallopeptidase [Psychroflexus sp. ALD_RP9]|uniref:M48 family metallopeptidase n=1 Tax=Psychroflexus sp. ALD_RP9 TaxID=2777186 RepID=UPI001A8F984E|nr:SprT family zinc-dependent metalloprotease [Psychroflexus sp. ALD_RP9]QSS97814.1 M48 family metallopeptidase [Psychroflexus sp. ALD_RP9]
MRKEIQFGSVTINYELVYAKRKTLGITVKPDKSVLVKAPEDAAFDKIEHKIRKKAPWILRQKQYFLSFEPRITKRKYVTGESILYLGRQYQLRLIKADYKKVKYEGRFIEVYSPDQSREEVKLLVYQWYRNKADKWFFEIASPWIEKFKKFNVQPNKLEIKQMKYRWGSCSAKGRILLNPELIKAPKACIEYVIVHELCHLIHHDHTKAFFELQTKMMPDWEKWKNKLENLLA